MGFIFKKSGCFIQIQGPGKYAEYIQHIALGGGFIQGNRHQAIFSIKEIHLPGFGQFTEFSRMAGTHLNGIKKIFMQGFYTQVGQSVCQPLRQNADPGRNIL